MQIWALYDGPTHSTHAPLGRGGKKRQCIFSTYSKCFAQSGGSLMVMNTQFVRIVVIISMLNNVELSQGMTNAIQIVSYK